MFKLTSIVTSRTDPSRSVTFAKAAFPDELGAFFFDGVSTWGDASAGADDFVSPGIVTTASCFVLFTN